MAASPRVIERDLFHVCPHKLSQWMEELVQDLSDSITMLKQANKKLDHHYFIFLVRMAWSKLCTYAA